MKFTWKIKKIEKTNSEEEHYEIRVKTYKEEITIQTDSFGARHFIQDIDNAIHH
mgnify:FL=1|jgi:hypothetical protein|tara:strand:+ start:260 stop:421 length:162 start_codon:yes stop_codon:yes gene_type:complete